MMATIHDVAKRAKVSPSTVSKYMNKTGYVSPAARERLQAAIAELNYHPNKAAKQLRMQSSDRIVVILPNIVEKLYNTIFTAINTALEATAYHALLFTTDDIAEKERAILLACEKEDYAGMIICTCQMGPEPVFEALQKQMPVVFLLRMPHDRDVNFIGFDHASVVFALTDVLLKSDVHSIALYTDRIAYSSEMDCVSGFQAAFSSNGLSLPENHVYSLPFSKKSAYRTIMRILDSPDCPEAFIVSSRVIADAIAEVATLKGVALGETLFIIALGEESWYDLIFFQHIISTFRPAFQLGETAAQTLLSNIASPIVFEKTQRKLKDGFPCARLRRFLAEPNRKSPRVATASLRLLFPEHESGLDAMRCLANQYSRRYGVNVTVESAEYHAMYGVYQEMMRNQTGTYDLLAADLLWTPYLAANGLLMELEDFEISGETLSSRFPPKFLEVSSMYNGKLYAYPYSYGTELLFYRQDLFSNPALRADFYNRFKIELAPPQDWFTFNLIARYFTRKINPDSPVPYGAFVHLHDTVCDSLYSRMWAYGGEVFDKQGQVRLYSDENIRALKSLTETLAYTAHGTETRTADQCGDDTAMIVTFCSFAPDITNRINSSVAGRFEFAPVPAQFSIASGWTLGVNRYSAHTKEAYDFLRWFMRDESAMAYTILGGNSAHQNIYKFPEIRNTSPWMDLAFGLFPYCRQRASIVREDSPPIDPMRVEGILSASLFRLWASEMSVEDSLRRAHKELCELAEESGFPQHEWQAFL